MTSLLAPQLLVALLLQTNPSAPSAAAAPAAAETRGVLSLDAALAEASRQSLELRVAAERLEQARTLSRKAWSFLMPQVSAGASYAWNSEDVILELPTAFAIRNVGTNYPPTLPPGVTLPGAATPYALVPYAKEDFELQKKEQWGVQAEVKQAILAPQAWAAVRTAGFAREVAEAKVAATRQDLLLGVAQLYYGAATLKEAVGVQERALATWQRHEDDAGKLVQQGAAPKLALTKARTDRLRAEQELLRTRNALAAAKLALATVLVRDPDFEVERPAVPAEVAGAPEALERAALESRPEVKAARSSAELAGSQRLEAWSKVLPTVGVSGQWRYASITGFTGEHEGWSVMLGLQWALFDGGRREAEISEAAHRSAEADAALALTANKTRDEVRRAALDLSSARAALAKAREQAEVAREAMDQAEKAHAAGAATALELADATTASQNADLGLVAAGLDADLAQLKLAKATGRWPGK
ncbi:MAG: TolC family protein [Anaeromyxobacter sp.]